MYVIVPQLCSCVSDFNSSHYSLYFQVCWDNNNIHALIYFWTSTAMRKRLFIEYIWISHIALSQYCIHRLVNITNHHFKWVDFNPNAANLPNWKDFSGCTWSPEVSKKNPTAFPIKNTECIFHYIFSCPVCLKLPSLYFQFTKVNAFVKHLFPALLRYSESTVHPKIQFRHIHRFSIFRICFCNINIKELYKIKLYRIK